MKFLHLADLHFGKRLNERSLVEDQNYIVDQVLDIAEEREVDGVLIAGDVYDKNVPAVEAIQMLDRLLSGLAKREIPVCMVGGNHDSNERLEFGSRLFARSGVHIVGGYQGYLPRQVFTDAFGAVNVYFLPFVRPPHVNAYYPGNNNTQEAVARILEETDIDISQRNILIAHQFVTAKGDGPVRSESETILIGTLDNVEAGVFEAFDYVALGHIHRPQRMGRETIRYAGSPLKYSFSEAGHEKSAVLVELLEKGTVDIQLIPLHPLHELRELKGPINALLDERNYSQGNREDYVHVTLTDEEELYDGVGRVRSVYPNLLRLDFENARTARTQGNGLTGEALAQRTPYELFEEFCSKMWGGDSGFTPEQEALVHRLLEQEET